MTPDLDDALAALRQEATVAVAPSSAVQGLLAETDPDQLTAKAALDLIYRLKKLLVEEEGDRQIER